MVHIEETEILISFHPQCEGIFEKAYQSDRRCAKNSKQSHLQEGNV